MIDRHTFLLLRTASQAMLCVLFLLIRVPSGSAAADEVDTAVDNGLATKSALGDDGRPSMWFPVGERLTYRIKWGPISVANTVIASEWIEEDGRLLLVISVTTRSTPFFDKIYLVDDMLESVVDPETFLPLRFTKRLSEGRHKIHQVTVFNHEAGTASWTDLQAGAEKELALDPDTRCLLSFMFFMRSQLFEPDTTYHFKVMADDGIHDLDVCSKSYETIKLPFFGKVKSILLEPYAPFHGLFVRVGEIRLWVSDDERRVLTQGTAGFSLGTISVFLRKVEGAGDDSWSIIGGDV